MTKARLSASEMLVALGGKTVMFEVDKGVEVELRSLDWGEGQALNATHGKDAAELTFQMAYAGLVSPKLEEAQFRGLRAGVVAKISKRVAEISGMADEEGDSPLAGGGSSA